VIAEIMLESERFAQARRHARASLALAPEHARTHYLLGQSFENDPYGDDHRAARCFRRASRLVPASADYRAALGRACVRRGKVKRGVRELLAAADIAPKDAAVLSVVLDGLLTAGKVAAARRIIVKARFLCPGNGAMHRLWERLVYEEARRGQRRASSTQDAGPARDGGAQLLPFLRVVGSSSSSRRPLANVRRDGMSLPQSHLPRLRATNSDG